MNCCIKLVKKKQNIALVVIFYFVFIGIKFSLDNPNLPSGNRPNGVLPVQNAKRENNQNTVGGAYKDFANRNNKEYQKQKAQQNKQAEENKKVSLVVHYRPENMPSFPDGKQEYKNLFDNEFTNFVDKSYTLPDDKDIFISQNTLHRYNEIYKHGNNEEINQISG